MSKICQYSKNVAKKFTFAYFLDTVDPLFLLQKSIVLNQVACLGVVNYQTVIFEQLNIDVLLDFGIEINFHIFAILFLENVNLGLTGVNSL